MTRPVRLATAETSPRRKDKLRRVFYLIIILIGVFASYAWATGGRQEPIDTGDPHMKAIVYTRFGPPDVLEIRNVKQPVPDDDQILINVRAASVNPLDWHFMRGTPYIARIGMMGLRRPKAPRLGVDVAGQVCARGRSRCGTV
jgi:hypothetical protein